MYIINISYKTPLEKIDQFLNEHILFLEKYHDKRIFICSGRKKPRTGGIILACDISREVIEEIIKEDPFFINDLADYEIIEFMAGKYHPAFEVFF